MCAPEPLTAEWIRSVRETIQEKVEDGDLEWAHRFEDELVRRFVDAIVHDHVHDIGACALEILMVMNMGHDRWYT